MHELEFVTVFAPPASSASVGVVQHKRYVLSRRFHDAELRAAFTRFHYESLSPRIRTSLLLSLLYATLACIFWISGSRAGVKEAEHPAVVLTFTFITLVPPVCVLVMHARCKITAENYQLVMTINIVAALVGGVARSVAAYESGLADDTDACDNLRELVAVGAASAVHATGASLLVFFLFQLHFPVAWGLCFISTGVVVLRRFHEAQEVGVLFERLPAWIALALMMLAINLAVGLCAVMYHDQLCHQFLLTLELQRSTEERIERLAREKERLGYDYAFAVRKAEDLAADMLMLSTWPRMSEPRGYDAQALPPQSEPASSEGKVIAELVIPGPATGSQQQLQRPTSPARSGSGSSAMWQQLRENQVQLRSDTIADEGGTPVDPRGGDDSFIVAPPPARRGWGPQGGGLSKSRCRALDGGRQGGEGA